jgi:deazaflavin-dependent oxidoreductase (nitroreductase family)
MIIDIDHNSVIDLTTLGRVSGRPHTIEIWFAQHGWSLYLLSGGGTSSDWVRNLIHTPGVGIRVGADEYAGTARLVSDPLEARTARDAVHNKYAARHSGDLTSWRETAIPIAVDLDPTGTD